MTVRDTHELSRLANSFLRDQNVLFIAAYNGAEQQPLVTAIRDNRAWETYRNSHTDTLHYVVGQNLLERAVEGNEFSAEAPSDVLVAPVNDPARIPASRDISRIVVGLSNASALKRIAIRVCRP